MTVTVTKVKPQYSIDCSVIVFNTHSVAFLFTQQITNPQPNPLPAAHNDELQEASVQPLVSTCSQCDNVIMVKFSLFLGPIDKF